MIFGNRHKHDWTKWEITGTGEIKHGHPPLVVLFTGRQEWYVVGEVRRQERKCNSCGLTEVKTEKIYF
jgi:hypothetical protein